MKRVLRRSLKLPPGGIDFTSNDYLGLSRSQTLYNLIADSMAALTVKRNGSTGSRLLSGNSQLIEDTEKKLAALFKSEAGLFFDSGYSANLAVLSTLPQRGDTIIMDELSHASLKDGARLSLATKWNFRHNDVGDLRKKLESSKGKKFIVVESIYSMDGDECPLDDIVEVARDFDAQIILDEAHTTGVRKNIINANVAVHVYTFGKAMGIHGAFVASSSDIKNLLVNFSRPFIYTTAPSDHSVVSASCAFDFLEKNAGLREELKQRIDYFRALAKNLKGWNGSGSQVQVVIVPGHDAVTNAALHLQSKGFDVRPILSPTVKEGHERLRICLHTFNSEKEIESLVSEMILLGL